MKKIFYWRFSRKIEGEFWIFYKRFPWKKNWMEEIFKGISLKNWSWIHTRASLKTFFDPRYRPPTPVLMMKVKWSESEWMSFWSFKSAENFWGGSVHVGGHRYSGIFCASKLIWVYGAHEWRLAHEGRLARWGDFLNEGRHSQRR